jgi:dihydroflavonol-4-reductase
MFEVSVRLGASGFVGAHLVRHLCAQPGTTVRALARETSDLSLTKALPVDVCHGDVLDPASLKRAMRDVDLVYHCVVNARAWLRDPAILFRTNVDGLRNSLQVAERAGVRRFVLTSTVATIAPRVDGSPSDETDHFDAIDHLPAYVRSRIEAERLFFDFIANSPMEGVAGCPSNTFGANDILPTPQGQLVFDASRGRLPFYWDGGAECVGIEDVARGMVLIADRGRSGERYILSERWISWEELFRFAARHRGRRGRLLRFPPKPMFAMAAMTEWCAARLGVENKFSPDAIRCSNELCRCTTDKARQELGWKPQSVSDAVAACIDDQQDRVST